MQRAKHRVHGTTLTTLFGLLAALVAACAHSPGPSVTATAFPSPTLPPTVATQTSIQQLPIPATGVLAPAPDGMLLAGLDASAVTLTLYDLAGAVVGHYSAPAGERLDVAWLPDSSGLLIAQASTDLNLPGPLLSMGRSGTVRDTGLTADNPALSPDGLWIAGDGYNTAAQQDEVDIVPRGGGTARVLARGALLAGWQNGRVIYLVQGATPDHTSIYAIAPGGGTAQLLTTFSGAGGLRPIGHVPGEAASSPDDQVLLMGAGQGILWMLVGNALRQPPPGTMPGPLMLWVGTHDVVGVEPTPGGGPGEGNLVIVDIISGAVVRNTGRSNASIAVQAVSGEWIVASDLSGQELYAISDETGVERDLGAAPESISGLTTIVPCGQGQFILHNLGTEGPTYLINPTRASG